MKKSHDPHETVKQYFPFYPAMWLTSRKLRVCSSSARGVLTDLMAMCWEAGGTIEEPLDILAAAIRETPRKLHTLLRELAERERIILEIDDDIFHICVPHLVGIYDEAVQHIEAKRAAGVKGAEAKYSTPIADPSECHSTPIARARGTGPDRTLPDHTGPDHTEREKGEAARAKTPRFVAPTSEEVDTYSAGIGMPIDGAAFVDYWQGQGWKRKSGPVRDWQATGRTWYRNMTPDEHATLASKRAALQRKAEERAGEEETRERAAAIRALTDNPTPACLAHVEEIRVQFPTLSESMLLKMAATDTLNITH